MAEADLSKVISLIMENPAIVEQIRNMVEASEKKETNEEREAPKKATPTALSQNTYTESHTSKRNERLRAISPYLSEERGKAIETMITIADIITAAKKGM